MTTVTNDSLRALERLSIRSFVDSCAGHLTGDVLDFGAGPMPYRDIVEDAGGDYTPFDRTDFPGSVAEEHLGYPAPLARPERWDAILCTQVVQYFPAVLALLIGMRHALADGGVLVMTGPTNWPEVESEDLQRYTLAGIRYRLEEAGFVVERSESRASIEVGPGVMFSLGWGCVARA